MREHWVHVEHDFASAPDEVFVWLSQHENLSAVCNTKFLGRLAEGETHRDGVGAVRRIRSGPAPAFEETVIRFEPPGLIEYKITKGTPLRGHVGIQQYTPLPD